MPSSFAGMDPFLEGPHWLDFQLAFLAEVEQTLAESLPAHYRVEVERRMYVERWLGKDDGREWAEELLPGWCRDVEQRQQPQPGQPVECLLLLPMERKEPYLVIRNAEMDALTIVEMLSPANKRSSSDGRAQYIAKRAEILQSRTNLVEIDLLRGGKRLPVLELPLADYYAVVSRGHRRPRADVFHWTIRDKLPTIPIPLRKGEPDVPLDLQRVFTTVFDRAGYTLDYAAPPAVPLSDADAAWVKSHLTIEK